MAFVVEDGTGVVGANAYCEVAFVTDYLTDRNRQTENGWNTASVAAQQAAIVAATDYIETRFGHLVLGYLQYPDKPQGLSMPRTHLRDRAGRLVEGIPDNWKKATAEYAVRAVAGAKLMPDPVVDDSGRAVKRKREVIGPIVTELEYEGGPAFSHLLKPYPAADRLLYEYLAGGGQGGVYR